MKNNVAPSFVYVQKPEGSLLPVAARGGGNARRRLLQAARLLSGGKWGGDDSRRDGNSTAKGPVFGWQGGSDSPLLPPPIRRQLGSQSTGILLEKNCMLRLARLGVFKQL